MGKRVKFALNESPIVIALCSKQSVDEPWISFEAGAGWLNKSAVIPVCHSGLRGGDLQGPLRFFQAIEASSKDGLKTRIRIRRQEIYTCSDLKAG